MPAGSIIRQNLGVSLGMIALLLVVSVFGRLKMSWAVVFQKGRRLVVVLNALRLFGSRGE